MKYCRVHVTLTTALMFMSASCAWAAHGDPGAGRPTQIAVAWAYEADDKNDPAYEKYRDGYDLILDEKWDQARRKFDEVIRQYTNSKYIDDARYWSAYALMHTNRKKAAEAYRRFIRDYPRSSYFEDAVADYARLQMERPPVSPTPEIVEPFPAVEPEVEPEMVEPIVPPTDFDIPAPDVPPIPDTLVMHLGNMRGHVVIDLRRLEHDLQNIRVELPAPAQFQHQITITAIEESTATLLKDLPYDERLDRSVRIKIEALHDEVERMHDDMASKALQECILDSEQPLKAREYAMAVIAQKVRQVSPVEFQTMRKIALDQDQPLALREVAISSLARARRSDVLPVLKEIARQDPSERSKTLAIEAIGQASGDRTAALETLIQLFRETPQEHTRMQQQTLNAIAHLGNDRAMQFVEQAAEACKNSDTQRHAIYLISEMDKDKNRSVEALARLFKAIPKQRKEQLETLMYSVANIGNDKAIDFLATVAQTGDNDELRSNAMFYLTSIGGEKARTALYKILERK